MASPFSATGRPLTRGLRCLAALGGFESNGNGSTAIYADITRAVGGTPLVYLNRVTQVGFVIFVSTRVRSGARVVWHTCTLAG